MNGRQHEKRSTVNRISEALGGRGLTWLSDETGIRLSTLSEYNRGAAPRVDKAMLIARALNVDVEWLFGDQVDRKAEIERSQVQTQRQSFEPFPAEFANSTFAMLPEVDIGYSMGGGMVIPDHVKTQIVPFPRDWIRDKIKGSFDQLFLARGEGDSMHPTLLDGDVIVVDTAQNAINSQDRLWCLGYGDLGMIKRVRSMPDGGLRISSDNPAVDSFTAYDGEVQVIGRVVWIGRKV